jgi:uncharacterized DUF497 family protein
VKIEWDERKALANRRKHGVSFEEASELFTKDTNYLEIYDDAHSQTEDRFIAIGPIARGLVLVAWTEQYEDVIRIISARWATRSECHLYQKYMEAL